MRVSNQAGTFLIILFCALLASDPAGAWSNGGYSSDQSNPDYGTHDWIAEEALALQTKDVTFLKTTYHSEFLLGTEAPDNPEFIGDTSKHHIYFYASHQLQDDACAVRASQIYETALDYMLAGNMRNAAFDIGVMAHYISDPGVFGHTMGAYTDWGTETHHSDYESKFETMIDTLPSPTGLTLGNSSAYSATLDLGYRITFGGGAIQTNVWMDDNYDWSDATFKASAIASLHESVSAVAAVINHLMIEASYTEPPQPPPPPPPASSPQVPQPPISLTASLLDSQVVLTWSPPPSDGGAALTNYVIYRGTDPANPSYLAMVSGSASTYTDDSPTRGQVNCYWITAENSMGMSNMSQMASVYVPANSSSSTLPITLSVASAALASVGILLWRRRR